MVRTACLVLAFLLPALPTTMGGKCCQRRRTSSDSGRIQREGVTFKNGDLPKIAAIDAERVTFTDGRSVANDYLHMDQGHCVTGYSTECRTVDQYIGLAPIAALSALDAEDVYVGTTRGRFNLSGIPTTRKPLGKHLYAIAYAKVLLITKRLWNQHQKNLNPSSNPSRLRRYSPRSKTRFPCHPACSTRSAKRATTFMTWHREGIGENTGRCTRTSERDCGGVGRGKLIQIIRKADSHGH